MHILCGDDRGPAWPAGNPDPAAMRLIGGAAVAWSWHCGGKQLVIPAYRGRKRRFAP